MLKVAGLKQRWIIGPWLNIPHQCRTLVTILAQAEVSENGTSPVLSSTFIAFSLSLIPANGPVNFLSDPYGSTGTVNGFPSKPLLPSTNFATAGLLPLGPASVFPNPLRENALHLSMESHTSAGDWKQRSIGSRLSGQHFPKVADHPRTSLVVTKAFVADAFIWERQVNSVETRSYISP